MTTTGMRELERVARLLGAAVADEALGHVRRAFELERDRMDAELAELRDEIVTLAGRTPSMGESLNAEVEGLNRRMTKLTETVAGLMQENTSHSRRVES